MLASRAEHHPVVGDLLVESAHSLMATGYSHEAQRLLRQLEGRALNWRLPHGRRDCWRSSVK